MNTQAWRLLNKDSDPVNSYNFPRYEFLHILAHPPRKVLDIGCGTGSVGAVLREKFSDVVLWGVEPSAAACAISKNHYNHVINAEYDENLLLSFGLEEQSIDTIVLADVLEHVYNPWQIMESLHKWLSLDAQILVSLPNVRNLWLINELIEGRFGYDKNGILDITHIRFFTKSESLKMFVETGYEVKGIFHLKDERIIVPQIGDNDTISISYPHFDVKDVKNVDLKELSAIQNLFLLKSARVKLEYYEQKFPVSEVAYLPRKIDDIGYKAKKKLQVIAFYLPQFHAIPENDRWWGKGFTEWSNVIKGRPLFKGHYQPHVPDDFIGYYCLKDLDVFQKQIELAHQYGIDGFCFYIYWFSGKTLLESPVEMYSKNKNLDRDFCLCWANENWTRKWDGLDQEILIAQQHSPEDDIKFISHFSKYFFDDRYIRINGKPLLVVYKAHLLPNPAHTISRWRKWCNENNVGELFLVFVRRDGDSWNAFEFDFDGAVDFPIGGDATNITQNVESLDAEFSGSVYDWRYFLEKEYSDKIPKNVFQTVVPSWDNTPRRGNLASVLYNSHPDFFQRTLLKAFVDTDRNFSSEDNKLVFINAWNEWAEGAHLEPDNKYGYAWLQAVRNARELFDLYSEGYVQKDIKDIPVNFSDSKKNDRNVSDDYFRGGVMLNKGHLKGTGTAIIIHLYYSELWSELCSFLKKLSSPCDLYISLSEGRDVVLADIVRDFPDAMILCYPNRGRDIAPRLGLLRIARNKDYDQLLFIHSKKSSHLKDIENINIPFLQHKDGDRWRRELLSELLSNTQFIIDKFAQDSKLGLVGPRGFWLGLQGDENAQRLSELAHSMRTILDANSQGYFAGSMFWCRPEALDPLLAHDLKFSDFEEESGQLDGTLAHVVERLFTLSVIKAGYEVRDTDGALLMAPLRESTLPWLLGSRCLTHEEKWAKESIIPESGSLQVSLLLFGDDSERLRKSREKLSDHWLAPFLFQEAAATGNVVPTLNDALKNINGNWLAIVDAGDQLAPDAIFRIQMAIQNHPEWQLIYTDEDSLTADGQHLNPHCKPDFNIDYLRSLPYIGGLLVIKKELFETLGGFDLQADGAEDYDFVLRAWEKIGDAGIGHIPEVLYHRLQGGGHCNKSVEEILQVSQAALQRHLQRLNIAAEVLPGPFPPATRVRYPLTGTPLVSIIIPTRNQLGYLQRCVESLIEKTKYAHYEMLIVDNDSDDAEARTYLDMLVAQEEQLGGRLRVLRYPGPFNFSAMNNRAVEQARGDYILLLNNDTAALHDDWLDEMVSQILRPEVGVVGAKLLFPDGKIQHAGVILGMRGPAEHPFIGQPPEYRGYFGRAMLTQNLSAVTGACLLIKKSLYQELGGLDEKQFQVSYNDIDLCLKAREAGHKIVFTPWAMLLHEGSASQRGEVEKKPSPEKEKRFAGEKMAFYQKWLPQLAFDPAYNRHLSLASTDFLLEDQAALTWDPEWRPRPRILVHPADREGCGEYRIISPMRALQKAGRAQGWETMRIFEPAEMERFSPESIVLQRQMEWPQIEALERHKKLLKTFRVFEIDDLITNLPVKSLHKAQIHKDIAKRFRKAAGLCNRLVVATEPLAKAYKGFADELRVQPNCIEEAIWGALQPRRRAEAKPRVGWAGGVGHTGDLEMIADVVRDLADEVDWVFFGLCPDALRPYVREFHTGVPLPQYPSKLASLDLDLALAPLENNSFNEAKSHLRILEYGILGYPVICSDIFPYQGNFPVTRVANRYRDWVRAIREQIADRQALATAGDHLREYVRAHWLLEEHLDDWLAAWLP